MEAINVRNKVGDAGNGSVRPIEGCNADGEGDILVHCWEGRVESRTELLY